MSTNEIIEANEQLANLLGDTISLLSTNDSQASLSTINNVTLFSFCFINLNHETEKKKKIRLEIKLFN